MAGNPNVYGEIADYLETIQNTLIWPTLASKDGRKPGPRPDSLVYFTELMMLTYRKTALLFDPVPTPRRCETNDECEQDEECVQGVCVPIRELPLAELSFFGQRCQTNDECEQDEECIMGRCVPIVGVIPGAVANVPIYDDRLSVALEAYLHRLQDLMFKTVVIDARKVPQIRHILMEFHAEAAKIAGKKLTPCDGPAGCPDGSACVNGVCVPVPFRLLFKPSPFRAPRK